MQVKGRMPDDSMASYDYDDIESDVESSAGGEDTEEASEAEQHGVGPVGVGVGGVGGGFLPRQRQQYTEIKEQMYQDKLAHLKRQLQQLTDGTLPEWSKKLKRIDVAFKERLRINTIVRDLEVEMIETDYLNEKKLAVREFEEHKIYLKEQLITELEEKQKMIETERHNMELTGDNMELKPISTRKLRRRANDAGGGGGGNGSGGNGGDAKRRKPAQLSAMTFVLDDSDIIDDLKIINKNKAFSLHKPSTPSSSSSSGGVVGVVGVAGMSGMLGGPVGGACGSGASSPAAGSGSFGVRDIRVEDGKLFYEKRWFRRGQSVQVEQRGGDKFPAMISAIGTEAIWVRKQADNAKLRIYITQLTKGKFTLKRRAV